MIKQWAKNSLASFRAGDHEAGVLWLRALVDQYHDSRTAEILWAVEKEDWSGVITALELTMKAL